MIERLLKLARLTRIPPGITSALAFAVTGAVGALAANASSSFVLVPVLALLPLVWRGLDAYLLGCVLPVILYGLGSRIDGVSTTELFRLIALSVIPAIIFAFPRAQKRRRVVILMLAVAAGPSLAHVLRLRSFLFGGVAWLIIGVGDWLGHALSNEAPTPEPDRSAGYARPGSIARNLLFVGALALVGSSAFWIVDLLKRRDFDQNLIFTIVSAGVCLPLIRRGATSWLLGIVASFSLLAIAQQSTNGSNGAQAALFVAATLGPFAGLWWKSTWERALAGTLFLFLGAVTTLMTLSRTGYAVPIHEMAGALLLAWQCCALGDRLLPPLPARAKSSQVERTVRERAVRGAPLTWPWSIARARAVAVVLILSAVLLPPLIVRLRTYEAASIATAHARVLPEMTIAPPGPTGRIAISEPITDAQYSLVSGSLIQDSNQPAKEWFGFAQDYCDKLSELEGYEPCYRPRRGKPARVSCRGYRLPRKEELFWLSQRATPLWGITPAPRLSSEDASRGLVALQVVRTVERNCEPRTPITEESFLAYVTKRFAEAPPDRLVDGSVAIMVVDELKSFGLNDLCELDDIVPDDTSYRGNSGSIDYLQLFRAGLIIEDRDRYRKSVGKR